MTFILPIHAVFGIQNIDDTPATAALTTKVVV
jgi:hypothetical protein